MCVCVNIHSPEPQTCLGEPGKVFLITIVFAKVKKRKDKKQTKIQKKKKTAKKRTESFP